MMSLALGGILFMCAATYMSSFDKEAYARQGVFEHGEFYISYAQSAVELNENGMSGIQAESPMNQSLIDEISAIDGVRSVETGKNFGVRF